MWGQSPIELFIHGGPVMWPLLACSIVGLAIVLERAVVFWLLRTDFGEFIAQLQARVDAGRIDDAVRELTRTTQPMSRVAAVYLQHRETPREIREQAVAREGSQQLARYEQRLNWLAVIAHVAPMLGLLGTVTGLVSAFYAIELKGGQVQPGDLASGIWEALLTTVFGLTIALPVLSAYHVFEHRAGSVALQMQWLASYLDEWLHHEKTKGDRVDVRHRGLAPVEIVEAVSKPDSVAKLARVQPKI